jgi:PKD repeat protein
MRSSGLVCMAIAAALIAACGNDDTGPSNVAPTVGFTIQCGPFTCDFTNASVDPDGTIATYLWDFDDQSGPTTTRDAQHVYAPPGGEYTVTLTVTDDEGATATATATVRLTINVPPTASFTWSCLELTCEFTNQSTDPEGRPLTYAWDFGDDASHETGQNPTHTFPQAGEYEVKLVVMDQARAPARTAGMVAVVRTTNGPPQPSIIASCASFTCSLTAIASDADGFITGYHWDFGDGQQSDAGDSAEHTFEAPGSYTVRLTVADDGGTSASTTVVLTLPQPERFVAEIAVTCDGVRCSFSSNGSGMGGQWNFGDGQTSSDLETTHLYDITETTTFTVTLLLADGDLNFYNASRTITVTP